MCLLRRERGGRHTACACYDENEADGTRRVPATDESEADGTRRVPATTRARRTAHGVCLLRRERGGRHTACACYDESEADGTRRVPATRAAGRECRFARSQSSGTIVNMTPAKSLAELLAEWEEQSEAGHTVALEELCRDTPELLETLRRGSRSCAPELEHGNAADRAEPCRHDDRYAGAGESKVIEVLPSIPGYTVTRKLGRGGMGVVYLAVQEGLERLVAIKMLPQGSEAERTLNRFRTEAEVIARLQHPNLIQIYEVGAVDGRPFFSMEYVADGNLEERLGGRPQAPREAARLVQILAAAMHEAHRCGVVHRDLKPGNILLRREAGPSEESPLESGVWFSSTAESPASFYPKITDFGLAKRLDAPLAMTVTHSVLGTPCYMAPEQARGDSKHVAETTDIYSLGAILYELLTGRPPFKGGQRFHHASAREQRRPRAAAFVAAGGAARSGGHLPEVSAEEPGQALSQDDRPGRGPAPVSRERADPGPADGADRARGEVGAAAARPGGVPLRVGVVAVSTLLAVSGYHNVKLESALLAEHASALESRHRLVRLEVAQGNNALDRADSTLAMLWFADALRLDDLAKEKAHRLRLGMAAPEHSALASDLVSRRGGAASELQCRRHSSRHRRRGWQGSGLGSGDLRGHRQAARASRRR